MKTLMEEMAEIQKMADELPGIHCQVCGTGANRDTTITIRGNGTERTEMCDSCYEDALTKLNK